MKQNCTAFNLSKLKYNAWPKSRPFIRARWFGLNSVWDRKQRLVFNTDRLSIKRQSLIDMTLVLQLHCFLASLSFIHFGSILAWPATGIPAIRWLPHIHDSWYVTKVLRSSVSGELGTAASSWLGSVSCLGALLGTSCSWLLSWPLIRWDSCVTSSWHHDIIMTSSWPGPWYLPGEGSYSVEALLWSAGLLFSVQHWLAVLNKTIHRLYLLFCRILDSNLGGEPAWPSHPGILLWPLKLPGPCLHCRGCWAI